MAQVNPENSTPMPAEATRRRFLSQAAGIAAGGAVLALATIPPALAAAAADPIFALIDAHKLAQAKLKTAEAAHAAVERDLQARGLLFPKVSIPELDAMRDPSEQAM